MADTVASTVRKGISIINLWFEVSRDYAVHSFAKAIDIETNGKKNVRCVYYYNDYFIWYISLVS